MAKRLFSIMLILWLVVQTAGQGFAALEEPKIPPSVKALAHFINANIHEFNGESYQALAQYQKAVEFDPTQAASRLKVAAYAIRFDQTEEAIKQLKTVITIAPETYHAHYLLALIYSAQKKLDLAAKEYEEVLKSVSDKNPLSIGSHIYLAQLFFAQGKYPQAREQFEAVIAIEPNHVGANFLLGSIYLDEHEHDKATVCLLKVLKQMPDHDGALNALAYSYAERRISLDKAKEMAKKAVDIDPTNGAYYDTYGWVLYQQGNYAESLMALQKAESLVQDPIVYDHLGDVYKALNQLTLARKSWLKSLQYDAKQPTVRQKIDGLGKEQALELPAK